MRKGDFVRVSGIRYGSYDGEIGRVYGPAGRIKGKTTYAVDMGGTVITVLETDLTVEELKKDPNEKTIRFPKRDFGAQRKGESET